MSETFCILPWMQVATNASGTFRVCCNSTPGKNFIKVNGHPAKIYRDEIEYAWNSVTLQNMREMFLSGKRPDICERCFREEDSGVKSARQSYNEKWMFNYEKSTRPPLIVKYIELRLGNLCNLKCRMCNPYASSQWVKEWGIVDSATDQHKLPEKEVIRLSSMDWPKDDYVWRNIAQIISSVEEIYLTGGEPTLSEKHYDLLENCINGGYSKTITLKYNTNLTNIPKKLLEYWTNFKKVKIHTSVDAYGDLNRYIRYPSDWNNIANNLDIFYNLTKKHTNLELDVHTTVQMYNILYLAELFAWLKQYGIVPYLNILNHPDYLNIRCLPEKLKEQSEKRLQLYLDKHKVAGLIKYMWAEDWSHNLPMFVDYTKTLDISRNQSIDDVCPDLSSL